MNAPKRYREKPRTIEAMLYDGTPATCYPIHEWLGIEHGGEPSECGTGFGIDTSVGFMFVSPGWYVVRDGDGVFMSAPDVFEARYEVTS